MHQKVDVLVYLLKQYVQNGQFWDMFDLLPFFFPRNYQNIWQEK